MRKKALVGIVSDVTILTGQQLLTPPNLSICHKIVLQLGSVPGCWMCPPGPSLAYHYISCVVPGLLGSCTGFIGERHTGWPRVVGTDCSPQLQGYRGICLGGKGCISTQYLLWTSRCLCIHPSSAVVTSPSTEVHPVLSEPCKPTQLSQPDARPGHERES